MKILVNTNKNILIVWLLTIMIDLYPLKKAIGQQNNNFLPTQLTRVNLTTSQQSYRAKAQFFGLVANGVNQVSTVTLYPDFNKRLSVIVILPQNCRRIFEITDTKISKVTYDCPNNKVDESAQYSQWFAFHNATTREVQIIAPPIKVDNPLYIRKQSFWMIQY